MEKSALLKQKQAGVILIVFGGFISLFIALALYFNAIRVPGFPELLPADRTVAYLEFPTQLEQTLGKKLLNNINVRLGLNLEKDVAPWAGPQGAVALVTSEQESSKVIPFVFMQVQSVEKSAEFLKGYKPNAFSFAFFSDVLVIAPSAESIENLLYDQKKLVQHLSTDSEFANVRKNVGGTFFAYIKQQKLPPAAFEFIANRLPPLPTDFATVPTLGIAAEIQNGNARGKSYALLPSNFPIEKQHAYTARLLSVLPTDFNMLLAGENITAQLEKLKMLSRANAIKLDIKRLLDRFTEQYFPGLDYNRDIAQLLEGEFAATVNGDKVLFIIELTNPSHTENIERLREAFAKSAEQFPLIIREVKLPDGTRAQELMPDKNAERKKIVFDAVIKDMWLLSNDPVTLQETLGRIEKGGANFRETELYRRTLQPIMKNPELVGVISLPELLFSFSKRTLSGRMEVEFMLESK